MWLRLAGVVLIAAGVLHGIMGERRGALAEVPPLLRAVWHLAGLALVTQGLTLWLAAETHFASRAAALALGFSLCALAATAWAAGVFALPTLIFAAASFLLFAGLVRRGGGQAR